MILLMYVKRDLFASGPMASAGVSYRVKQGFVSSQKVLESIAFIILPFLNKYVIILLPEGPNIMVFQHGIASSYTSKSTNNKAFEQWRCRHINSCHGSQIEHMLL